MNVTGTETGDYFFNALIDLNMDGKWGDGTGANGETEWVVQNVPVTVTAGVVTPVTSPAFAYTNGLLVPDRAWMRVALTKEQVPQDWDGTGQFSKGEIEDYPIMPPIVDGKEIPMIQVDCGGPYSFGTNNTIPVTCTVKNLRRKIAGAFTYEVVHTPNGGTVGVSGCLPAPPGPIAIGAARLPNGAVNPAATVPVVCTATKGNTPDAWTFKATVVDPVTLVDNGTIFWGQDTTAVDIARFSTTVTEPPPGELDVTFTPDPINEEHKFGQSPCPQPLGQVFVFNSSSGSIPLAVIIPTGAGINVFPSSGDVPPGDSLNLNVDFTCASTDDIDTTLTVNGKTTNVMVDVTGAP